MLNRVGDYNPIRALIVAFIQKSELLSECSAAIPMPK